MNNDANSGLSNVELIYFIFNQNAMKTFVKIVIIWLLILGLNGRIFAQNTLNVSKVSLTVSNLARSVEFFEKILSFKKIKEYELSGKVLPNLFGLRNINNLHIKCALMQIGSEQIELLQFLNTNQGRSIPSDSKSNDLWFQHIAIVVSDMDKAYQKLWENKVAHVSTFPQTLPAYIPNAAGIKAFYFQDPDGHNLELIYFPKDKGNPKWQKPENQLFMGIDHTAIGVGETEQSLPFYRDILGLKVRGTSHNYGTEQEHLNQVFGARLWISGLGAENGFGIEFLDYISPLGGRAYPPDSQPIDLWHWHTSMQVNDLAGIYQKLQNQNYRLISTGIIDLNGTGFEAKKGLLVRDNDGHAIFLYE
jgi:catechol 2,3-dioxygenase-like lactoylglutathione lyase family enzyme